MSRFYDAMRKAFEDEETSNGEAASPVQAQRRPLERPQIDIEDTLAVEEDELTIPDIQFTDTLPVEEISGKPAPLRPVPDSVLTQPEPIHPSYERIIQRLTAFRGGRRHCVVLVAGAVSGEGATTVCRNIAGALAHSHEGNVVLVDANLRQTHRASESATVAGEGLAEILAEKTRLKSVLEFDHGPGLAVLPSGGPIESPQQLFTVPRLQSVVTSLHSQFDWILLDGPPVTTYPESSSLAVVADGAILVLRAEQTRWEVAEEAKKVLEQAGVSILGGVLNRRKYHIPNFIYRRL